MGTVICTWLPCGSHDEDERVEIHITEQNWKDIQALQAWWAKHGEKIWNAYHGIERVEPNGDLVLDDVDVYLEARFCDGEWKPGEEELEREEMRKLFPDMEPWTEEEEEEYRRQQEERAAKRALEAEEEEDDEDEDFWDDFGDGELDLGKYTQEEKKEEDEGKSDDRSSDEEEVAKEKKSKNDLIGLMKHGPMKVAVNAIIKLLDDSMEDEEEENEEDGNQTHGEGCECPECESEEEDVEFDFGEEDGTDTDNTEEE